MQVVGSKLCKRAERGCNLSKRFMSRGGAAPPPLALAEIATPLSSFAQFAANHLHFTDSLWDRVLVCMHLYGSPPSRERFPPLWEQFPHPPVAWELGRTHTMVSGSLDFLAPMLQRLCRGAQRLRCFPTMIKSTDEAGQLIKRKRARLLASEQWTHRNIVTWRYGRMVRW